MAKKNVASIAKKRSRPKNTEVSQKSDVAIKTEVTKQEDDASFRDKAKRKAEELLGDITYLNPKEKKDVQKRISSEELGGVEWLSEQLDLLSKENENLKNSIKKSQLLSEKKYVELKNDVISFFIEFYTYHKKWGKSFKVDPPKFINKLIKTFPFLEQYKKQHDSGS